MPWSWLDFLAVGIAVVAVFVSWRSVRQARWTAQANIVLSFLEEYGTDDMFTSLRALEEFQRRAPDRIVQLTQIAEKGEAITDEDIAAVERYHALHEKEIGAHRRRVLTFYSRAWRCYKRGYLTENGLRTISEPGGRDLLFDVVEPMTRAEILAVRCEGSVEKYREELDSFAWFRNFQALLSHPERKHRPLARDYLITGCSLLVGALLWFLLNSLWPLSMDNMSWHPNLVTAASVLLGFGLGHAFPTRFAH